MEIEIDEIKKTNDIKPKQLNQRTKSNRDDKKIRETAGRKGTGRERGEICQERRDRRGR